MNTVHKAIAERRSVGEVSPAPLGRERIRPLLEAALWAPNHKMTQPTRFVVLSEDARDALGDAHAAARRRLVPDMSDEALLAQRRLTARAPHIVVVIHRGTSSDPVVRREDRDTVAAAVQNLLLAAHADGLGAVWRTGAFVDEPEVRAHLGCGDDDEVVGFVYLGQPEGPPPPVPPRPHVDAVTEWRE